VLDSSPSLFFRGAFGGLLNGCTLPSIKRVAFTLTAGRDAAATFRVAGAEMKIFLTRFAWRCLRFDVFSLF